VIAKYQSGRKKKKVEKLITASKNAALSLIGMEGGPGERDAAR
jgi:hypothetical protein